MARGPKYTRAEWLQLYLYYCLEDSRDHDDNSPKLIAFANLLGRSPGSVDAQLRTIKHYEEGDVGFYHGSKIMEAVVAQYRGNLLGLTRAVEHGEW